MKNNYMVLAEIIKSRRISLGYSLRQLANEVGISHTELARIENGNRQGINVVTLIQICKVLNLNFVNVLEESDFCEIEEDKLFYVLVKGVELNVFKIHAPNEARALLFIIDLLSENDLIKKDPSVKNLSIFATCEKEHFEKLFKEFQNKTEEEIAEKYNKSPLGINEITSDELDDLEDVYEEFEEEFDEYSEEEPDGCLSDIKISVEVVKK